MPVTLRKVRDAAAGGVLVERTLGFFRDRAASYAFRGYLAVRGPHAMTFDVEGSTIRVDSRSHLAFPLWRRTFERENLKYALGAVHPGDVVVDVGANVGLYAVPLGRRVGPGGRVFAFEPCPPTAARLAANLAENGLRNVEIVPFAAHATRGTAEFHVFPEGMDVYNSLGAATRREGAASQVVVVQTLPLDDFLAERGVTDVALLKADVEGAEELVLRGAQRLLEQSSHLRVLVELQAPSAALCGCSVEGVIDRLALAGYRPHLATRAGLRPVSRAELIEQSRVDSVNPIFTRV